MIKKSLLLMMLFAACFGVARAQVTIGDLENAGNDTYLPMNSLYEYSYSQQIYTAEEIGMAGTINSITVWLYGNANLYEMPFDIYMVETDKESFESTTDWVAVTSGDIVYSGSVTVHNTDAEAYTFELETPFFYSGSGNLVIAFDNNTGLWKSGLNGKVFTAEDNVNRALYARRDSNDYDPTNMSGVTASGNVAKRNVIEIDITPSGAAICYKPTNVTVSDVTAHTATVSWTSDAESFNLMLGDDVIENVSNPYTLTGLTPETAYTVKVKAICGGESGESDWTNGTNFTTEVACPAPTALEVTPNALTATFTWESGASSWDVTYGTDATADPDQCMSTIVEEATYTVNDLELGDYYFWVRANCGSEGYSSWAGPVSVHIGYCVPNPTSHDGQGITGVSFGTGDYVVTNGDGSASLPASSPYYGDYSSMIGAVQAGVESTIAITTSTGSYPYTFVIWVDFDNSLSFEDSEVVYVGKATSGAGTLNATITIPTTQELGDYRMRIYGADSYFTSFYGNGTTNWEAAHDPCSSGTYRHAHDYTLRLLEAPSCMVPSGLTVSNVTAHEADLTWTENGEATAWIVEFATDPDFTNVLVENVEDEPSLHFQGLAPETTYYVHVKAVCSPGNESDYSSSTSFTTTIACPAPTDLAAALTPGDGSVATLSWTSDASAWVVAYKTADDEEFMEVNVTENPYTLTGLTPETAYTAKVKADCGGIDGESAWSNTVTFTPSNAYTLTVNDGTNTHSYVPFYGYYADSDANSQFIIPASALTDMQWGTINKITFYGSTASATWNGAVFDIYFSEVSNTEFESAALVDWSELNSKVYTGSVSVVDNKMELTLTTPYQYMGGNLLIGFDETTNSSNYPSMSWYGVTQTINTAVYKYSSNAAVLAKFLPKVTFDYEPGEEPSCFTPTNFAVNYEGGITATVTWDGTATSYNIDVNGTVTEGVTSPYILEDLELNTTYAVMVQADCGSNGTSEWTSPVSFTTDLCLPENMCAINIALTDSYGDGWNGGQLSVVDALTDDILGTYTLASGSSADYTLNLCDGLTINIVYTAGSYSTENGWVVTDINNEVICEHVGCNSGCDPTAGVQATYTVDCFPCNKPTNLAAEIQNYTSANLTWDGTNDSYNLRYREAYFYDDFENGFAKWNVIDADGDGYGFVLGSEVGGIYLVETGSLAGTGHNGSNDLVVSASYSNVTNALTPDNYMVSPKLELGHTFSFWACSQDASYPAEHFGVAVSTVSNNNPDDFTTIAEWTLTAKGTGTKANPGTTRSGNRGQGRWYQFSVDLSEYAGEEGYIAIRHFDCTDQFILNLDDVTYGPAADESWTVVEGLTTMEYLLENLNEHTDYEFQLQGVCGTTEPKLSDWTSSAYFTTLADEPQAVLDGGYWNVPETWTNNEGQVPSPDQNVTVMGDVLIGENLTVTGDITIADGATLTVEAGVVFNAGEINVTSPDQLIIEQGAQFMHTSEVPATLNLNYSATSAKDGETEYGEYRMIASPITPYVTVNSTGLVPASTDANYQYVDLYYFDQTSDGSEWINYKDVNNHFVTLDINKGYLYSNAQNVMGIFAGTTLPTDVDVTVELDSIAGMTCAGWNLVGNPFTCMAYIDRPYFKINSDGNAIADAEGNSLEVFEGVFVKGQDGETMTFTTTEPTRSANLALNLSNDNNLIDRAIVRFDEGRQLPKFQLNANSTKVYIQQDGVDYAIVNATEMGEMPVSFKAENNGTYTMSFSSEEVSFNYLHLIDNMTGNDVDLLATPSYTFNARTTDYANRFKLVFVLGATSMEENFAFFSNGSFIINNEGEATLQVIDVNGRILKSESINGCTNVNVNAAPGVYMLRLVNGDNVMVQKVVVR